MWSKLHAFANVFEIVSVHHFNHFPNLFAPLWMALKCAQYNLNDWFLNISHAKTKSLYLAPFYLFQPNIIHLIYIIESLWLLYCLSKYFPSFIYIIYIPSNIVFATSGRYFGWVRTKFAHPVNGQGRHQWRRKAWKVCGCCAAVVKALDINFLYNGLDICVSISTLAYNILFLYLVFVLHWVNQFYLTHRQII